MPQLESMIQWAQSYKGDAHKTGFLDLPRELRDVIYNHVFRVQGAIYIFSPESFSRISTSYTFSPNLPSRITVGKARIVRHGNEGPIEPRTLGRVITLSMMRVCRQLHAECAPVLYGGNVFRIGPESEMRTSLVYRQLVRHVTFKADVDYRVYKTNLEDVNYGWKRRFWPSVVSDGSKTLERYPNLETLTILLTSPKYGQAWRPAMFAVANKTKEQRIALAVGWLQLRCPLQDERLRACLKVELVPPSGVISKEELTGSRFAVDEDEEAGWDCAEFAEAFQLMLRLPT
jgi:hypothetical protein